uniref:Uncharacterized protein n=1 Tax=Anguilla anguilla TaxID=7936 RepID=A0A0E9XJ24_ANGAN
MQNGNAFRIPVAVNQCEIIFRGKQGSQEKPKQVVPFRFSQFF